MKVQIGNIAIGDGEKIAVQSMCNTKTTDIDGSIQQILQLEKYGCDMPAVCGRWCTSVVEHLEAAGVGSAWSSSQCQDHQSHERG